MTWIEGKESDQRGFCLRQPLTHKGRHVQYSLGRQEVVVQYFCNIHSLVTSLYSNFFFAGEDKTDWFIHSEAPGPLMVCTELATFVSLLLSSIINLSVCAYAPFPTKVCLPSSSGVGAAFMPLSVFSRRKTCKGDFHSFMPCL